MYDMRFFLKYYYKCFLLLSTLLYELKNEENLFHRSNSYLLKKRYCKISVSLHRLSEFDERFFLMVAQALGNCRKEWSNKRLNRWQMSNGCRVSVVLIYWNYKIVHSMLHCARRSWQQFQWSELEGQRGVSSNVNTVCLMYNITKVVDSLLLWC